MTFDTTYQAQVYLQQGGNKLVIGPSGVLENNGTYTGPTHGTVFYVDSATGSDSATGLSWGAALATIDAAVGKCTASKGDLILVAPGHAETLTASTTLALDVAGITVVGLGDGPLRPTITLGTDTTATVTVGAANVTLRNVIIKSNVDSLAQMVTVTGAGGAVFEDCLFWGPATKDVICFVDLPTTFDNFTFRGCTWLSEADPTGTDGNAHTGGIYLVDTEVVNIIDCHFHGYFETACIHNKTTACKWLRTRRTTLNQLLTTTGTKWRFPAATTGVSIDHTGDATYHPGLGYKVTKTEDVNTATSDDLFTLAGKVKINLWECEVTDALNGSPTDYQITLTTLAGVLVAAGNIASAIVGHMFLLNGDAGDTSLNTSTSAVSVAGVADGNGKSGQLVVGKAGGSDVIKSVRTAGASGDAIVHTVFWQPLEVAAYLVDAA